MPQDLPKSWRKRWITVCILVLFLIVSVSSFLLIRYLNRSTPEKTLDAFCNALLQANYRSAYDQFSARLQQTISEKAFAGPLSQDRVTACTHGTTGDSGNQVTSELKFVHVSQGKNDDMVTLVKDSNNDWKIDDIARLEVIQKRYRWRTPENQEIAAYRDGMPTVIGQMAISPA